jgi:predicted ATP-grasp superfamily ATP-dependent carboligase
MKLLKGGELLAEQAKWPSAVIAGAFQTGVLGVRSLKRRGIKALCFDCDPTMPGFRSVYGPARLCPDPDREPQQWVEFMIGLSRELEEKAVLIPSSDRFVTAIASHSETLQDHFLLSPGIHVQGLLAQKQTQYRLAMEHGMPMPLTGMVDSFEELQKFSQQVSYPCLIKPWHFREWGKFPHGHPLAGQKVAIATSSEELFALYELARPITPSVIVQDIIQGPDTAKRVYLSCYDRRGNRIADAMFRELRCVPFQFGPASVSEPFHDPEADIVCDSFLRKIGYSGICEIEVKRDSRDGLVKLIEANPRLSGGGDAAPYAGVDLCWIHYLDMVGRQVEPVSMNGKHFRHIVLRAEGFAIPAYMRAGLLSWKELFDSYRSPLAFFDFDLRDWRYSLATLFILIRSLFQEGWKGCA